MVSLAVAVLGAPVEGKAVVKAHAVLAHQLPVEVSEAERGQLFAGERQVRSLENLTQNCFYLARKAVRCMQSRWSGLYLQTLHVQQWAWQRGQFFKRTLVDFFSKIQNTFSQIYRKLLDPQNLALHYDLWQIQRQGGRGKWGEGVAGVALLRALPNRPESRPGSADGSGRSRCTGGGGGGGRGGRGAVGHYCQNLGDLCL